MTLRFIAAGFLLVSCGLAQTPQPENATATPDASQPKFVMADVHVSTTPHNAVQVFGGVVRNGRYVDRDETMLQLIEGAYGVDEDNVGGGPGWVSSDLFDVIARVPDGTTSATAKLMVQALLADRFKLVLSHDTRPLPRYVLSVDKGGSKLETGLPDRAIPSACHKGRAGDAATRAIRLRYPTSK